MSRAEILEIVGGITLLLWALRLLNKVSQCQKA